MPVFRRVQRARDKRQTTYLMLAEVTRVAGQSLWIAASAMTGFRKVNPRSERGPMLRHLKTLYAYPPAGANERL